MSKIIVSLAGWCEADPARTMFQYIGPDGDAEKLIGGEQWLSLPEYDPHELCRDDYILENALTAFKYSVDGEYDHIEIEVTDE